MPVWPAASISDEPELALVRWRILETDRGSRHIVGARADDLTGRISTPIVQCDPVCRMATTESGRIYHLNGEPRHSGDAEYLWQLFCEVHGVTQFTDVSATVLAQSSAS